MVWRDLRAQGKLGDLKEGLGEDLHLMRATLKVRVRVVGEEVVKVVIV